MNDNELFPFTTLGDAIRRVVQDSAQAYKRDAILESERLKRAAKDTIAKHPSKTPRDGQNRGGL